MSNTPLELLSARVCEEFAAALFKQAARRENNFVGASFYGEWFRSPLPYNNYATAATADSSALVATNSALVAAASSKKRALALRETVSTAVAKVSADAEEPDDGRKRIKMITVDEISRTTQPNNTVIDMVNSQHEPAAAAVTTTSYDGRTRIGADTLRTVYGADQRMAVETLKDNMERRFAPTNTGVIAQIAQTMLVLAVEPVDFSMEIMLLQRFDTSIIVENLRHLIHRVENADAEDEENDDDTDDEGDRLREFRRHFKRMSINMFSRFPELAIECNESSSTELLRAVSSFWIGSSRFFANCRSLPYSESARDLRPELREAFERALGDRSELLYATAVTNIEGIGAQHWQKFRDLLAAGLITAHLQVAALARAHPGYARFTQAKGALLHAYRRVQAYRHSSVNK